MTVTVDGIDVIGGGIIPPPPKPIPSPYRICSMAVTPIPGGATFILTVTDLALVPIVGADVELVLGPALGVNDCAPPTAGALVGQNPAKTAGVSARYLGRTGALGTFEFLVSQGFAVPGIALSACAASGATTIFADVQFL